MRANFQFSSYNSYIGAFIFLSSQNDNSILKYGSFSFSVDICLWAFRLVTCRINRDVDIGFLWELCVIVLSLRHFGDGILENDLI
tara:strand:- start:15880 stop:16134 length:255 start_codon:yes stop_codon:yes gene_type:complete